MSESDSDLDLDLDSDFDEVLVQLTSIQEIQEDALMRLEHLKKTIECAARPLTISVDGVDREWDEVLDELHAAALRGIRETGKNTFGTAVRHVLSKKIEAALP